MRNQSGICGRTAVCATEALRTMPFFITEEQKKSGSHQTDCRETDKENILCSFTVIMQREDFTY
jgi:hypothetical protein